MASFVSVCLVIHPLITTIIQGPLYNHAPSSVHAVYKMPDNLRDSIVVVHMYVCIVVVSVEFYMHAVQL